MTVEEKILDTSAHALRSAAEFSARPLRKAEIEAVVSTVARFYLGGPASRKRLN